MTPRVTWSRVLAEMPLIAILRGIEPQEAIAVATALHSAGFLCAEVPLNSPDALQSIEKMRANFEGRLLVGAGTVLSTAEVVACQAAGAEVIVSPNTNAAVIETAKTHELISLPGFLTPSEAFTAIAAGADALKLFPAESASPVVLRALKAVIPKACPIFPVGGIGVSNMQAWVEAGAAGFGIGSALYTAKTTVSQIQTRATAFVNAWKASS